MVSSKWLWITCHYWKRSKLWTMLALWFHVLSRMQREISSFQALHSQQTWHIRPSCQWIWDFRYQWAKQKGGTGAQSTFSQKLRQSLPKFKMRIIFSIDEGHWMYSCLMPSLLYLVLLGLSLKCKRPKTLQRETAMQESWGRILARAGNKLNEEWVSNRWTKWLLQPQILCEVPRMLNYQRKKDKGQCAWMH